MKMSVHRTLSIDVRVSHNVDVAVTALHVQVLTIEDAAIPFSTLAVHATLPNGTMLWKMFSRSKLSGRLDHSSACVALILT